MKTNRKIALALSFVLIGSQTAFAVDREGNGGDRLVKQFERARELAEKIISELTPKLLENKGEVSIPEKETLSKWFARNQDALLDDIRSSQHRWVERNPNNQCGYTAHESKAQISLSLEDCKGYTDEEAAAHLIGESLHHFDKDNQEVSVTTNSMMKPWNDLIELRRAGIRIQAASGYFVNQARTAWIEIDARGYLSAHRLKYSYPHLGEIFLWFPEPLRATEKHGVLTTTAYFGIKYSNFGTCSIPVPVEMTVFNSTRKSRGGVNLRMEFPAVTTVQDHLVGCPKKPEDFKRGYYSDMTTFYR